MHNPTENDNTQHVYEYIISDILSIREWRDGSKLTETEKQQHQGKQLPMPPQAFGELMLVPFISCEPRSVQLGTDAIAAPGALMHTPSAPSCLQQCGICNCSLHSYIISNHPPPAWI